MDYRTQRLSDSLSSIVNKVTLSFQYEAVVLPSSTCLLKPVVSACRTVGVARPRSPRTKYQCLGRRTCFRTMAIKYWYFEVHRSQAQHRRSNPSPNSTKNFNFSSRSYRARAPLILRCIVVLKYVHIKIRTSRYTHKLSMRNDSPGRPFSSYMYNVQVNDCWKCPQTNKYLQQYNHQCKMYKKNQRCFSEQ